MPAVKFLDPGKAPIPLDNSTVVYVVPNMTVWLTVAEAAEYVKVSEWTIREAVKLGDLKAYPVGTGRSYRLRAQDIDAWMTSRSWEPRS